MKNVHRLVTALLGVAAATGSTPAAADTLINMGTLAPGGSGMVAVNQDSAAPAAATALSTATHFDLKGSFDVGAGTQVAAYRSLIQAGGQLTNLTAGIYSRDALGAPDKLVAQVPVTFSNANSWLFQSPVSFSLAPGKYLFDIAGDKQAGRTLNYQLSVTAVPLPPAVLMFGAGLIVVGAVAWGRRRPGAQAA